MMRPAVSNFALSNSKDITCLIGTDIQAWSHELARLHEFCFPETPWSAKDFTAFKQPICVIEHRAGLAVGYALASLICEEAELMSLGVECDLRGQGIALNLMMRLHKEVGSFGARRVHLEVAESNIPALRLYTRLGYDVIRTRIGYYKRSYGSAETAICMSCDLMPLVTTL